MMIDFFKKTYNIFIQQNWGWLDQYAAHQSRPMLFGFALFVSYLIILFTFNLTPPTLITGFILGTSFILVSLTGVLWIREDEFPFYITGLFKGSIRFQRVKAYTWVIMWGIIGFLMIILAFVE
ncbi:MAG: hypothetical protein QM730_13855 [Anaerolineales bacterium]